MIPKGSHGSSQTSRVRPWDEEDWVTLSALQHYSYCPRQWALIYKEQIFQENVWTMKGRLAHERADDEGLYSTDGIPVLHALTVWSDRHGLTGKCDIVEIRDEIPYPVEYKHGRLKTSIHDEIQLCAQAMCLEDMFGHPILEGAIYHISSRRRRRVPMTPELRQTVVETANAIREESRHEDIPSSVNDHRCTECSLIDACLPTISTGTDSNIRWFDILKGMNA